MTQTNLTPQTKEIISRLYSSNEYNKREAIYRILFDRRADLLPELKKAVKYEKNESIAVFMVQVCLTLTSFPRDAAMERRILEILQYEEGGKVNDLTPTMWDYLEKSATSQMIIAILASMGNSIPANSYDFIEMCLTHPDPDVRTMVCEKAIKSGRPSHFAYVLNLVVDKDPIVSQTAFLAIKNLPEAELSIILDYALGSPDEWVLNTVAPFLPNLINNNLRSVIAKVQYHSNHNVAHKAREALKVLDAIPYITKRSMKDHDEAEKRKAEEKDKEKEKKEEYVIENGKKVSLKEQLEQKRKEQEEKDRQIKEANDALDKELAEMSSSEIEDFSKTLENYDKVLPTDDSLSENLDELPEEKTFIENTDFSVEANAFSDIDDKVADEAVADILTVQQAKEQELDEDEKAFFDAIESVKEKEKSVQDVKPTDSPNESNQPIKDNQSLEENNSVEQPITNVASNESFEKAVPEDNIKEPGTVADEKAVSMEALDGSATELDLNLEQALNNTSETVNPQIENEALSEEKVSNDSLETEPVSVDFSEELFPEADSLDLESLNLTPQSEEPVLNSDLGDFNTDDMLSELGDIKVEEVDLSSIDFASEAKTIKDDIASSEGANERKVIQELKAIEETEENKSKVNTSKTASINERNNNLESNNQTSSAANRMQNQPKPASSPKAVTTVSVPSNTKDIFEKYPSFLTDPLLEVFKANTNETKLKALDNVLTNLTAFLNICFLQSSMYYAQESDMLTKSIKDCIKGNLIGPSAIRCLHNFVLAMKSVRGSNTFFTFQLSRIMGNSQDETNPLMLMRELKDFLREPEEPLDESVPQAVDGMIEILRGIRAITGNILVMRAPRGAKLPYADLSGPSAKELAKDKRPSIDLPVGEIVLISSDGSEAFGLFPFFKYSKKKIIFTIPSSEELATFYERLEITP